jgi:major vault protein
MSDGNVIRIKPYFFIHVLDNNTNVTRVEVGPQTFTRQDHEKVVFGPEPTVMIPPRHYCIIGNPIVRDKDGKPVSDGHGQVRLKHGDEEIRFEQEPFPLYPGEKLVGGKVSPLQVVAPNAALRLRAIRDFEDDKKVKHVAGDEWLFEGPGTYYPRVEVQVVEITRAIVIKPNQAIKLRARKACIDRSTNTERKAGEEWLVRKSGAFLPGVDEEVVETVNSYILTDRKALHLKATRTFTDVFGKERKAGEEWLVTSADAEAHIPDVYEQVVGEVKITTLNNRQYCVVLDPIGANGKPQLGQKQLRKGEASFFLRPGESLEGGILDVYVLGEEEALLLRAKEAYASETSKHVHQPGDRWMIYGPCDYVPPTQVEIVEKRRAIPLDENEGIYVRDIKSGEVKSVLGAQSYLLKPNEELWVKELPKAVEELLNKERIEADSSYKIGAKADGRDKTRVVTYRAPHNSAVQIYDYKNKKSRVVFGPELVMLGPDEHFTVLSLSGDKPKRPHLIKALALQLGPDFMTDIVIVETADHARLSLKLSYNWRFETSKEDPAKIFQVPDFVGDSCKAIAARVRGAVAAESFDSFHKNSAKIIHDAVFGNEKENKRLTFNSNNLVITNIDIQSVEPVDQRTRDSLQKSVQLAIEITTKSQEAAARHEAERLEQGARGRLERQKINDEADAEKARKELLSLQADSAAVESTGQATAEAKARSESAQIEGECSVQQAQLKAEATKIKSEAELAQQKLQQEADLTHRKALNDLELNKARELSNIEAYKFKSLVTSIGKETIKSIAQAGPEMQAKLLQGLGLKSFMITDGKSPINLFNTAGGLIAPAAGLTSTQ